MLPTKKTKDKFICSKTSILIEYKKDHTCNHSVNEPNIPPTSKASSIMDKKPSQMTMVGQSKYEHMRNFLPS